MDVNPGSAMSFSGLTRLASKFLMEGTDSGCVHASRPSFLCPWARRSKLKRPLDLGASSTSILDPGLDLVTDGSVVVLFFSLPFAAACCLLCSRSIYDFIWSPHATISCILYSCSLLPSAGTGQQSPCLVQVSPGPGQVWLDRYREPFSPYIGWPCPVSFGPFLTTSSCC